MAETLTISPAPHENIGLDYSALKKEGINIIQALAGSIWTDYNEHDPGVTILEQLCYALTELSYRAEFSVSDLLTNENNKIDSRRHSLYLPQEILPCNPVTINDYRKLIIDQVKGIGNVWLTPDCTDPAIHGRYRIAVYVPADDECACDHAASSINAQVGAVYNSHRNVCEDLAEVFLLEPILTRVEARVSIAENISAEVILANIFFQLGLVLAPEVERTSLQKVINTSASTDTIFNGPLIWNGLIDDEQLADKPTCIALTDISNCMLMVKGVITVNDIIVISPAESQDSQRKIYSGNDSLPVPKANYIKLDTRPTGSRESFSISLFVDGVQVNTNARRVRRELEKLWKNFRRSYQLDQEYAYHFSLPDGSYRDLKKYYSIQNQFPNLYGINEYGVANDTSGVRSAQAKQLKGYLLVYDQLFANYFSQLAHIKELYSIDNRLNKTYFYQYLDDSVPNLDPLLKRDTIYNSYHSGLPHIVHDEDNFEERRNRFLDVMLAIYGQTIEHFGALSDKDDYHNHYSKRLIDAKITWLRHLVRGTCGRGQAFDYLGSASEINISGMEIKIRIQLDMATDGRTPLSQLCSELGVEIVDHNEEASIGKKLNNYSEYLGSQFSSLINIDVISFSKADTEPDPEKTVDFREAINTPINSLWHGQRLSEEFLQAATDISRLQIGTYAGQNKFALVCQARDSDDWHFIESYQSASQAQSAAQTLASTLEIVQRNCRQLYLVEHLLLRFALYDRTDAISRPSKHHDFDYSFNLSAVVSATREQRESSAYRKTTIDVIRQNTPAHLVLHICFISPRSLCRFEQLYWAWRQALKSGDEAQRSITSRRIIEFLRTHRPTKPTDETAMQ